MPGRKIRVKRKSRNGNVPDFYYVKNIYLNRTVLIIFSILILNCLPAIHAQEFENVKFDRLKSENVKLIKGLSQNWIYTILQDRYGYMWFGTWDGLNKYDGYNFTIYNVDEGLSDHIVYSLLEDDEGILWVGTDKGFNKFDRNTQTFKQYIHHPGDTTSLFHSRVNDIIQASDGSIWLGTGGGLIKFDKKTESLTSFLSTHQEYFSPRSNFIIDLFQDSDGKIWVSTTYGLVKFDPKTGKSTRYYHIPGDSTSLSNNNIRYVIQERSGNFWIGTRDGLNYFDTTSQKIKQYFNEPENQYSLGNNSVMTIYEDRSGDIWIGTDGGGLNYYERENDRFIRYQNILNDKSSLSNNKVYSIFEDKSGNLWVGTYKGVNKINKYYNDFKHCRRTTHDNQSLNSNIIWSFLEDKDENLWIGTDNGINIKNLQTGRFTYITHDPSNPNSPSNNDIRTMIYTPELNCIWLGIWVTGVDKYDPLTNKFTHYQNNPNRNSLSSDYANDIIQDNDSIIWIATGRGLNRFDPGTNSFEVFFHDPENKNSLSNDIIICLSEDSKGNLWVGTDGGLNKYIKSENKFIRFLHDPENENSLSNNSIFYIYEDRTGKIWVGTSGGGINKFNSETGEFRAYTTEDGLPNNIIYGILEDDEGNLWLSTNLGLSKFYVISERFVNYDIKDGIQSNEFNLGACYKDKKGKMYFGGMNGYNVFDPDEIKYNPNKPVVIVSAFRKFNEIQPEEYFDGDTIRLSYDDNFFSFEVSALDYTNPSKNKYRYKLENVDKDWVNTDADNRLAEYKKVSPGTYIFKTNGSNNVGIWNDNGISLTVIITPPWWDTWFFRIPIALLIIITIWIIIYRRVKRIRKKHEVEKKILEIEKQMFDLEQKALRLQMNPHFIFNSLNSIQSYILTHDTEKAVNYLGKFSQLMRLILSNSAIKHIPLKEELKAIRYYLDLEKLRFENKFDYEITLDTEIDEEFIEIPPMVIQPYIENAIIHGLIHKPSNGKIEIDFKLNNGLIICTVQDNGIGRKKAMQIKKESGIKKRSRGMLITKARLEILNRQSNDEYSVKVFDLKDKNGNASGTKVQLIIHYKQE